jgi:predicted dehydrogenase
LKHSIGIIGCGWVAPFHVRALSAIRDRVHVEWVSDPRSERMDIVADQIVRELGQQAPIKKISDYQSGLESVDSVFILLPHHLHYSATIEALDAGCHVMLEKPMTISLDEADKMIAKAAEKQRLLMVALPHRYRKTTQQFRELIESGKYGRLYMLDAMMDENLTGYADLGWIQKKDCLGGGVFFSCSPHMLDVILWIGGDVQTISMVGTHGGLAMEGEDTAVSILKFKSGVIATTRHTWASAAPKTWYTIRAYCEKANLTLTMDPLGSLVREGPDCAFRSQIVVSPPDSILVDSDEGLDFSGEVKHFFDCLDTGQACQTDGTVARGIMALVLEAYEKADQVGGNYVAGAGC